MFKVIVHHTSAACVTAISALAWVRRQRQRHCAQPAPITWAVAAARSQSVYHNSAVAHHMYERLQQKLRGRQYNAWGAPPRRPASPQSLPCLVAPQIAGTLCTCWLRARRGLPSPHAWSQGACSHIAVAYHTNARRWVLRRQTFKAMARSASAACITAIAALTWVRSQRQRHCAQPAPKAWGAAAAYFQGAAATQLCMAHRTNGSQARGFRRCCARD